MNFCIFLSFSQVVNSLLYNTFVCSFSPRYGREKPDKVQGWDRAEFINAFNLHRSAIKASIDADRSIPGVGAAEKTTGAHSARRGLRSEGERSLASRASVSSVSMRIATASARVYFPAL